MKNMQRFANILGMKSNSFSTLISQIRCSGKWGKKWDGRFEILAENLNITVLEILSILEISNQKPVKKPSSRINNDKSIKVGPRTFTQKDFSRRQSDDEWCFKTIMESGPTRRWVLTLCLSPIFPLLKKIEVLKLWIESDDFDNEDLTSVVHFLYMDAFEERMEFSWINPLLPEVIPIDIRISAAKKANLEISRLSSDDLQKLALVS